MKSGTGIAAGPARAADGFRVRRLHHLLSQRVEQAFVQYACGGSLTTMVLISAKSGYSQVELSRIGNLDKSAIVTIVDELEKRGLAIRAVLERPPTQLAVSHRAGEKLMKECISCDGHEQPLRDGRRRKNSISCSSCSKRPAR